MYKGAAVPMCCGQELFESKCTSLVTFVDSLDFRTNPLYRGLRKDFKVNFFYRSELENLPSSVSLISAGWELEGM